MEYKDIIKALECCDKNTDLYCDKCPFKDKPEYCLKLSKYALKLIKNQQAEIDKLQQNLKEAHIDIKEHMAEIEKLKKGCKKLVEKQELYKANMQATREFQIEQAKIEAYKEFADRLKEKASKGFWDELAYVDTEKIDDVYEELTERKED